MFCAKKKYVHHKKLDAPLKGLSSYLGTVTVWFKWIRLSIPLILLSSSECRVGRPQSVGINLALGPVLAHLLLWVVGRVAYRHEHRVGTCRLLGIATLQACRVPVQDGIVLKQIVDLGLRVVVVVLWVARDRTVIDLDLAVALALLRLLPWHRFEAPIVMS